MYAEFAKLSTEEFIQGEYKRRVVITTLWNIVVLILSIFTPNITVAIELLGSFAACNVFIFPGLCMVALSLRFENLTGKLMKAYGILIIITGAFMGTIVLFQVFNDLYNAPPEEHILCNCKHDLLMNQ